MSDQLSKISLGYSAEEDRLILRLGMSGGNEVRLAMTRRFVRLLWGALLKVLESNPNVKAQLEPDVKQAILSMQHQEALQSMNIKEERQPPPTGGGGKAAKAGSGSGSGGGAEEPAAEAPPEPPSVLVTGFRFGQGEKGAVARVSFSDTGTGSGEFQLQRDAAAHALSDDGHYHDAGGVGPQPNGRRRRRGRDPAGRRQGALRLFSARANERRRPTPPPGHP